MASVFYRRADGRVVRRVYRSIDELEGMLRSLAEGRLRADYSKTELEAMLDAKIAKANADNAALAAVGNGVVTVAPRRRNKLDRLLDSLPFTDFLQLFDPSLLTEESAENYAERVRLAHGEYQKRLGAEWLSQRKADRLIEDAAAEAAAAKAAAEAEAAKAAKEAEAAAAEAAAAEAETAEREAQALQWAERLDAVKDKVPAKRWNEVAGYVETYAAGTGRKTRSQIESYVRSREKAAAKG